MQRLEQPQASESKIGVVEDARPVSAGRLVFGMPSGVDVAVLIVAFLFVIAFAPFFLIDTWTPRAVLLLTLTPLGVAALTRLVLAGDRAAQVAAAVIAWLLVGAIVSGQLRVALFGVLGRETSWLIVCAWFGMWALGRNLSRPARARLEDVLVAAALLCVAVAAAQVAVRPTSGSLALVDARPTGLFPNPVYFGVVVSGVFGLVIARYVRSPSRTAGLLVAVFAFGLNLSGARSAVLSSVLVLTVVSAAGARRSPRGIAMSWVLATCGYVISTIYVILVNGRSAVERVESGTQGRRLEIWGYSLEALQSNWLLGSGIGRFRPAVQGSFDRAFVGPDPLNPWWDPHNIFVHIAVVGGVPALILVCIFVGLCAKHCRGPLAVTALAMAVTLLLQAVVIPVVSILMLILGASWSASRTRSDPEPVPMSQRLSVVLGALGVALGVWLASADLVFYRALRAGDAVEMERAASLVPGDPLLWSFIEAQYALESQRSASSIDDSVRAGKQLTSSESDSVRWWVIRADQYISLGEFDSARRMLDEGSKLQPWSPSVSTTKLRLAVESNDELLQAEALNELCLMGFDTCDDVSDARTSANDLQPQ